MTARGDRVVDGVYRALPDPVDDRLLSLLLALAAEVWTTRDRLRLVEAALAERGIEIVETPPDPQDRDAFVARLLATVA